MARHNRAGGRFVHIFGCLFLLFVLPIAGCKKKAAPSPPPEVWVTTLTQTNVPIFEEWIGTVEGFVNAQIRAQVSGYLMTQNYRDGSLVKKGDLLFQIDARPFQAALDQAEARLAQDKAQLSKTELDVKRYTPLAKDEAVSQEELDNAVHANLAGQAQVKADEAALETARLNLGFTKIISPVDGLAGIALAQIGDLVSPSSGLLTTVSAVNPIKVYFQVSEHSFLSFWRMRLDTARAGEAFPLKLILANGSVYPEAGAFYAADRQVNPNTGTLQIAGVFTNGDYLLRPGQYARVRAQTQVKTNVLVVPQRAITELQDSYQVTIVDESNKVHLVSVKVGEQVGPNWVIESGLRAGQRLVVEGLQKAKEGEEVNPKPWAQGDGAISQTNTKPQ